MDNASRTPAAGSRRRLLEAGSVPVLAQLPDVSSDLLVARTLKKTTTQEVGYRFDPPQMAERGSSNFATDRASPFRTLKSELVYAPSNARSLRPHVFDKARLSQRRRPVPRRESPILPRSNSFAIPRRGLLDSVAPVFRFAMLVALFTAAGTWAQVALVKNQPAPERLDTAKASVQRPAAGTAKTVSRPTQSPTAVGPVGTTPESATRVGRVREKDDFATLRGDIMPVEPAIGNIGSSSPKLIGPGLPHLQTTEPAEAEVARVPGFSINIPSR